MDQIFKYFEFLAQPANFFLLIVLKLFLKGHS